MKETRDNMNNNNELENETNDKNVNEEISIIKEESRERGKHLLDFGNNNTSIMKTINEHKNERCMNEDNIIYAIYHLEQPYIKEPKIKEEDIENEVKWIKFQQEYREFLDRKEEFAMDSKQAYKIVIEHCSEGIIK